MYKTAIVTDTNSGLLPEEAEHLGIHLVPMPVIVDEESFLNTFPSLRRISLPA